MNLKEFFSINFFETIYDIKCKSTFCRSILIQHNLYTSWTYIIYDPSKVYTESLLENITMLSRREMFTERLGAWWDFPIIIFNCYQWLVIFWLGECLCRLFLCSLGHYSKQLQTGLIYMTFIDSRSCHRIFTNVHGWIPLKLLSIVS